MHNVVPLFSFRDRDQVKELDRSHKEIHTLKESVDLYRRKAKEYYKQNDALRLLLNHYKSLFKSSTIPPIDEETDITHPSISQEIRQKLEALDAQASTELAVISDVIEKLQHRCSDLEAQLSTINRLSLEALNTHS